MAKLSTIIQRIKFPTIVTALALATGCSSNAIQQDSSASTQRQAISVHQVSSQGINEKIGTVYLSDSSQGLKIETQLKALPAGIHGFHIHEFGSCAPAEKDGKMVAALAAGGHFNPLKVAHGDEKTGHLGDLPPLNVTTQGESKTTLYAPRLKLADVQGLALMIHAGGDNHSDFPEPLGGGGARIACAVIQ